jgi:hypothetical protein
MVRALKFKIHSSYILLILFTSNILRYLIDASLLTYQYQFTDELPALNSRKVLFLVFENGIMLRLLT